MLKFENKFLELFQELVSKFTGTSGTGSNISCEGIELIKGRDGLNGQDGLNGKSAYEIWQDLGNEGTEQDFISNIVKSTEYKELTVTNEMELFNTVYTLKNVKVGEIYDIKNNVTLFDRIYIKIENYTCINKSSIFLYNLKRVIDTKNKLLILILNDNKFLILEHYYLIEQISNTKNGIMSLVAKVINDRVTGHIDFTDYKVQLVRNSGTIKIYKLVYNQDVINFIISDVYFGSKQIYHSRGNHNILDVQKYYDVDTQKNNYLIYSLEELTKIDFTMTLHDIY